MFAKYSLMFLCFLLQTSLSPYMAIGSSAPNFIVIGLVLIVAKGGPLEGLKIGIPAGLFQDLISSGMFGNGLIVKALDGFFAGLLKKQTFSDNIASKMAIAFLVTLIDGLASLLIINFAYVRISVFGGFFTAALPSAVYTGLLLGVLLIFKSFFRKASRAYGI